MSSDQASTSVVVEAPAKLTLSLRVTGTRADGYHLIDAEMVSLLLADLLTIDPTGAGLTADGPFADGVPLDDRNLVARALRFVRCGAAVTITKRIPHGGGLGGGSADAAAILRWAGWSDVAGAAKLGADVSFCLVGGRARVSGIGEIVEPLPHASRTVTLVVPPFGVSTPAVYRCWDELGGPHSESGNDLEPAAIAVEPRLAWWRDRISEASGRTPILAGSGATWFVHGAHPTLSDALADATVIVTDTRP